MSLEIQLYIITAGYLVCTVIAIWQALKLRKVYKSTSSWIIVVIFILWFARQVKAIYQLSQGLERAKAVIAALNRCGIVIPSVPTSLDRLTPDQWLNVVWAYAIIIGFVVYQHWQHRDLKKLGI